MGTRASPQLPPTRVPRLGEVALGGVAMAPVVVVAAQCPQGWAEGWAGVDPL